MTKQEFENSIKKDFDNIDSKFFDNIEIYKSFLQEYNKNVNLTRLDGEEKIYGEYFYESMIPYKDIDLQNKKLLDIGSGSGIPGVVLKLLYPSIELTVIDSNNKKIIFLKELAKKLNIDITAIVMRAEELSSDMRESFDIVTSRAVASLKIICELSIPFLKVGGILIEPKSIKISEELESAKQIIAHLKCNIVEIKNFQSILGYTHNIVIVKKNLKTPLSFPRK
jgi:16S rRNA (guanine527-N7)-methyltransferase